MSIGLNEDNIITLGDKTKIKILKIGNISGSNFIINNILLVDKLKFNHNSINQLYDNDTKFFESDKCKTIKYD